METRLDDSIGLAMGTFSVLLILLGNTNPRGVLRFFYLFLQNSRIQEFKVLGTN